MPQCRYTAGLAPAAAVQAWHLSALPRANAMLRGLPRATCGYSCEFIPPHGTSAIGTCAGSKHILDLRFVLPTPGMGLEPISGAYVSSTVIASWNINFGPRLRAETHKDTYFFHFKAKTSCSSGLETHFRPQIRVPRVRNRFRTDPQRPGSFLVDTISQLLT